MGLGWEEVLDILKDIFPVESDLKGEAPMVLVHGVVDFTFRKMDGDAFIFLGYVALPEQSEINLWLQKILHLNFAYVAEHEESLSWDKERHKLCVALSLSLSEETEDTFYKHMESFISQLEFWSKMASSVQLMSSMNAFFSHL
ncbi:MAG: CesT family type III secretion system chaperone [Puniceicoccales bacterium]|nr:CesT family type III secretion system chaperone [Puniceicoccales bacterium]